MPETCGQLQGSQHGQLTCTSRCVCMGVAGARVLHLPRLDTVWIHALLLLQPSLTLPTYKLFLLGSRLTSHLRRAPVWCMQS